MMLLLPEPYPDELLASVLARHQAHLGSDLWDGPLQESLGRRLPFAFDLPDRLDRLGIMAGERFVPARVIDGMTLAPFYLAYKSPERAEEIRAAMTTGRGDSAARASGIGMSRLERPKYLRFCPSCRDADLTVLGETYWRRTHQLACALVCPEHGQTLVPTDEPMLRLASKRLADATTATSRDSGTGRVETPWRVSVASSLARRAGRLLEGDYGEWPRERVERGYAPELRVRGYAHRGRGVDAERVATEMTDMFGSALLEALGAPIDATRHTSWFRVALRPATGALTTTEHLLIQSFIDALPPAFTEPVDVFGGPWRCNNPHAGHDGPTVASLESLPNPDGSRRWIGRCPCGQVFSFRRTLDGAPDTPVVTRNYEIGAGWSQVVLRLADERLSVGDLAALSGLSQHWVRKILAEGPGRDERRAAEILDRRERWEALLGTVPRRSRWLAMQLDRSLYKLLYRTDREWLNRTPRNGPITTVGNVVDWDVADEAAAAAIAAAAEAIGRDPTAPRVNAASLARSADLPAGWLYMNMKKGRLPRTAAAVGAAEETLQAYHGRKVREVARSLGREGVRPSKSRLRRAAGLGHSKYGNAEYLAMYELVLSGIQIDVPD